jgi:chromosome segregation ATPase
MPLILRLVLLLLLIGSISGCQDAWFGALEKVGLEKRELLRGRIEKAQAQQAETEQAYVSALEQFRAVVAFDGGNLERTYDKLSSRYTQAEEEARALDERIDAIEDVANALFKEWQGELETFSDASLKARSQTELRTTKNRCAALLKAMRRAEQSFKKPLARLRDRVLYLKHNLNAQAIGELKGELAKIESGAELLKRDLDAANSEADAFLMTLKDA